MLVDGEIISDGMGMISYLDRKLQELVSESKVATGIVIGSSVRRELTKACQHSMNQPNNPSETINRYRNVLLIEDGDNDDRLEVIAGCGVVLPMEGNAFLDPKRISR